MSSLKTLENTTFSYRVLPSPGFQFPPPPPKYLILLTFRYCAAFAIREHRLICGSSRLRDAARQSSSRQPSPSILEHTLLDLNPQLYTGVGSLDESLGRSSQPLSDCRSSAVLIAHPAGYYERETISSSVAPNCLTGADGEHRRTYYRRPVVLFVGIIALLMAPGTPLTVVAGHGEPNVEPLRGAGFLRESRARPATRIRAALRCAAAASDSMALPDRRRRRPAALFRRLTVSAVYCAP
jgi:hypothetical protein